MVDCMASRMAGLSRGLVIIDDQTLDAKIVGIALHHIVLYSPALNVYSNMCHSIKNNQPTFCYSGK